MPDPISTAIFLAEAYAGEVVIGYTATIALGYIITAAAAPYDVPEHTRCPAAKESAP